MSSSSTMMVAESVSQTSIPLYQTTWPDIPKSVIFVSVSCCKMRYFTSMDIVYNGLSVQGLCHVRIQSVSLLRTLKFSVSSGLAGGHRKAGRQEESCRQMGIYEHTYVNVLWCFLFCPASFFGMWICHCGLGKQTESVL
jgi:hypothetical protein